MNVTFLRPGQRLLVTGVRVIQPSMATVDWQQNGTWSLVGATWTNTPSLGSDLITNGGFAADTDWTKGAGWTITAGVASHASSSPSNLTQTIATLNTWYQIVWTLTFTSGAGFLGWHGASNVFRTTSGTFVDSGRAVATALGVRAASTGVGDIDNVSVKALTLNQLFVVKVGTTVTGKPTLTAGNPAGLVAKLDSISSPANGIFAYHDGTNVVMLKLVSGTYTQLISTAVTYSAGATMELRNPSGTTWQLWYNGSQRGTDQTISDASVVAGTLAGGFSTYSGNSIADLTVT